MVPAVVAVALLQAPLADSTALRHSDGHVPPTAIAVRVDRPPVIDGRLDDPAWALAPPVTQFRQTDPEEGKPVSESTEVRIVYDAAAIYIGARMYDRAPQKIVARLGRRDAATQSDDFRVLFDSYHDHRTAFRFVVNPAGVKGDVFFGDDGNYADDSWDPVWEVATTVDSL
ncbi:MAG TPA: carbohydrate binding family 9 domain-containing protein, partial [Gemmatimonadales bacterium]|nr:carbohydrate binding family 9 domain-containing protein [Gemmatimonadales bacterium]